MTTEDGNATTVITKFIAIVVIITTITIDAILTHGTIGKDITENIVKDIKEDGMNPDGMMDVITVAL